MPFHPFTEVNIDLVGPLSSSQGFRYLLTVIDRNTRWIEVKKLEDINSTAVMAAFIKFWISRYGVPITVITDRGT